MIYSTSLFPPYKEGSPSLFPDHQPHDYLKRAINALQLLDRNNKVVERCTDYIRYLLKVKVNSQLESNSILRPVGIEGPTNDAQMSGGFEIAGGGMADLPDLSDFLSDDLELAQFFASGMFDEMQGGGLVGPLATFP